MNSQPRTVDERVSQLLTRRSEVPDSLVAQQLRSMKRADGTTDEDGPFSPERLHARLTQLERMTLLVGATWDGELDDRNSNWLPYLDEKASRAAKAAQDIAEIAARAGGWAEPTSETPTSPPAFGADRLAEQIESIPHARRSTTRTVECPFCGGQDAKPSWTDKNTSDTGRMRLYCNNSDCDVREFEVIARTDGKPGTRADIEALDSLEDAGDDPAQRVED